MLLSLFSVVQDQYRLFNCFSLVCAQAFINYQTLVILLAHQIYSYIGFSFILLSYILVAQLYFCWAHSCPTLSILPHPLLFLPCYYCFVYLLKNISLKIERKLITSWGYVAIKHYQRYELWEINYTDKQNYYVKCFLTKEHLRMKNKQQDCYIFWCIIISK